MTFNCVCQEPMSPVRRTFCLLTLFDFLVSFLLWIIYTQIRGLSPTDAFLNEVVHYGIHSSLFDLVLLAAVRFTFLILAYGLFRLHNPWVVAVTTSISSGFLIAKVFLFTFVSKDPNQQEPILDYLLLLSSFVLSWAETWFLDFKVLPRELKDRLEELKRAASEISPLLYGRSRDYETSGPASAFYSPLGGSPENRSLAGDVHEVAPKTRPTTVDVALPSPLGVEEKSKLIQRARGALEVINDLLNHSDWKMQSVGKDGSDVHSYKDKQFGKVLKIEGVVRGASTDEMFADLYLRVKDLPNWNTAIAYSERVDILDETSDVCYVCVKDQAGGMVSARDFVDVRCYDKTLIEFGNKYTLVSICCEHPRKPVLKEFVRGENGPNAWILEPLNPSPDGRPRTLFTSILNTNLKGWLPQSVVDQALSTVQIDLLQSLRTKWANTAT